MELPTTMLAAVMHAPGDIRLQEVPVPETGDAKVLVKVQATALCTFEQRVYAGKQPMTFPWVGGHEMAGTVVAIGPRAVTRLQEGDQVAISHPSCGQCDECRRGFPARCSGGDLRTYHAEIAGGWGLSQYRAADPATLFKIDSSVPASEAALAEPLSCAVHASRALEVELADDVVVIGAGVMGLLNMMVSKLQGARVIACDLEQNRLQKALSLGVDDAINPSAGDFAAAVSDLCGGHGADIVITTVATQEAHKLAFSAVKKTGKVALFAAAHPPIPLEVDHNLIHKSEVRVIGTEGKNVDDFRIAAKLLSDGTVHARPLIEKEVPFSKIAEALDLASSPDTYRVVVVM